MKMRFAHSKASSMLRPMSDNVTKMGMPDRERVSLSEVYEVDYWTGELKITEARLRWAVGEVGNMAEDVRAILIELEERSVALAKKHNLDIEKLKCYMAERCNLPRL